MDSRDRQTTPERQSNNTKRELEDDSEVPHVEQITAFTGRPGVKLPDDILHLIFDEASCRPEPLEYISQLESGSWNTLQRTISDGWRRSSNVLANLSLVSKDWHGTAIPMLYRYLRLKTTRQVLAAGSVLAHRAKNPLAWIGASHGTFVRLIDIGVRRETGKTVELADVIVGLEELLVHAPQLRSFRTSTSTDSGSNQSIRTATRYRTRIVPNLVQYGRHLTTLEISDSGYQEPDIHLLINGLPALVTLVTSAMFMLELYKKRSATTSTSLKTIVIIDPNDSERTNVCFYDTTYSVIATWNLPNLHSLLVYESCPIRQVLKNMMPLLSKHEEVLKEIVFRRWIAFSPEDIALLQGTLARFNNTHSSDTSVQFHRHKAT